MTGARHPAPWFVPRSGSYAHGWTGAWSFFRAGHDWIPAATAGALHALEQGSSIRATVVASGFSHRRFIALFEEAVGLTPKRYCRVRRFQSVLARADDSTMPWSRLAQDAGYADQSHFAREFRAFAGMTPDAYRRQRHIDRNHFAVSVR